MAMVEVKQESDFFYSPYNSVNENAFTWKEYQDFKRVMTNDHGFAEMRFNLSDATLLGSNDHKDPMDIVETRYHVRFDYRRLLFDIYLT